MYLRSVDTEGKTFKADIIGNCCHSTALLDLTQQSGVVIVYVCFIILPFYQLLPLFPIVDKSFFIENNKKN